ncbi:MAG: amidohydrolase family protein [Atopobiaceae bacterium]|jgi:N-acyl-D-aspartate/D-glutamate deacylase|nr:amidohydrolase family protein [Atopobiaceae bacterium]MCH4119079.1 amidohydrolase family protein [Atopobiaceae bacterium]MCI1318848.1 amidohydrolase family protein [Atopobiaceae bacterium]MCI1388663.1 amidohydrolase family protein [Atopobiaceae bacterium]MCI1432162.1 amidohydrolase family protein [Atopobiaceae bacterium]
MYDFVIKNGLVVDGTGAPAVPADVGIVGDTVVRIAPKIEEEAADTYDAAGKYVIPGLIDPHVHEEWYCFDDGSYEHYIREGVTTLVNGNCSHSIVPGHKKEILDYYLGNGLVGLKQYKRYLRDWPDWHDFEGYAEAVAGVGTNCNFVTLLGHGSIRQYVMHGAWNRHPDEIEQPQIEHIIRHNMDQGMWGISFGLDYVPSRYATIEELCEVVNLIKCYDGVSAAHLRHKIGIPESTAEFCEVGRRTGAKIQISHLATNPDVGGPEAYDIALKAIEQDGVRARIDVIPSSVGHCTSKERMLLFTMALSDELFSQGIEGVKRALHDPAGRELIKNDNYTMAGPKDRIYIVMSEDPTLENRSVRDIAQERGIDEDDCMLDLLGDDKDYVFWLNAPAAHCPSNFVDHCDSIVANPYVSAGSDTIMGDPENPYDWYEIRRRGGMAIFAQMYVGKGVPYEEVVRRNTSMVADHFGIQRRGRLVEGAYADVAVIDLPNYRYPEMDQMQYKTPEMNATGCDLLLCNGKVELRDGELYRTYAGRVLKKNEQ